MFRWSSLRRSRSLDHKATLVDYQDDFGYSLTRTDHRCTANHDWSDHRESWVVTSTGCQWEYWLHNKWSLCKIVEFVRKFWTLLVGHLLLFFCVYSLHQIQQQEGPHFKTNWKSQMYLKRTNSYTSFRAKLTWVRSLGSSFCSFIFCSTWLMIHSSLVESYGLLAQ